MQLRYFYLLLMVILCSCKINTHNRKTLKSTIYCQATYLGETDTILKILNKDTIWNKPIQYDAITGLTYLGDFRVQKRFNKIEVVYLNWEENKVHLKKRFKRYKYIYFRPDRSKKIDTYNIEFTNEEFPGYF